VILDRKKVDFKLVFLFYFTKLMNLLNQKRKEDMQKLGTKANTQQN